MIIGRMSGKFRIFEGPLHKLPDIPSRVASIILFFLCIEGKMDYSKKLTNPKTNGKIVNTPAIWA